MDDMNAILRELAEQLKKTNGRLDEIFDRTDKQGAQLEDISQRIFDIERRGVDRTYINQRGEISQSSLLHKSFFRFAPNILCSDLDCARLALNGGDYKCFRNYRENKYGFIAPSALVCPAFGIFRDVFCTLDSERFCTRYLGMMDKVMAISAELCDVFENESTRRDKIKTLLSLALESQGSEYDIKLEEKKQDLSLKTPDGFILFSAECKNEVGTSGEIPLLQLCGYIRNIYFKETRTPLSESSRSNRGGESSSQSANAVNSAQSIETSQKTSYTAHTNYSRLLQSGDPCPLLGLIVMGTFVSPYACWFDDGICCEPLTDAIDISIPDIDHNPHEPPRIFRFLAAFAECVTELERYYQETKYIQRTLTSETAAQAIRKCPYVPHHQIGNRRSDEKCYARHLETGLNCSWGLQLEAENSPILKRKVFYGEIGPVEVNSGTKSNITASSPSFRQIVTTVYISPISVTDTTKVVIKYVPAGVTQSGVSYPFSIHAAAAGFQLAPHLYGVFLLPGGFHMVVMECLSSFDGWKMLRDLNDIEKKSYEQNVSDCLFSFQNLFSIIDSREQEKLGEESDDLSTIFELRCQIWNGESSNSPECRLAHGDIRDVNIMVREKSDGSDVGTKEVRLIDFDWASVSGKNRYPLNLNTRIYGGVDGIERGAVIYAAHDSEMLYRLFK